MFTRELLVAGFAATAAAGSSTVPQYFQTSPELFAGPTPTGKPAFLAQTNPAPFPSVSYTPPSPLETQQPISGTPKDHNIFAHMGHLTHYRPNPIGFGIEEHPLPEGAEIVQLHMLHRHGARYPTTIPYIATKLTENKFRATGELEFLNSWKSKLGAHILVPVGKQELFDSGTLHQYLYGHLYPNDGSKIVARTTTQDRMLKSAEYFLAGFFGLEWPRNVSLEVIIEKRGFNNSLSGGLACPNALGPLANEGTEAGRQWRDTYLEEAHKRLNKLIKFDDVDLELTSSDVYGFQSLCAYETVALGFSKFCDLFTFEEWQGFEYADDILFAGRWGFQSPTARAVGINWVQELRARLEKRYLTKHAANANRTLDSMPETFPLDQSLYFDFSHDVDIMAILTALNITQFNKFLPTTHIVPRDLIVSYLEPFAARIDIEIISSPSQVPASRNSHPLSYDSQKPMWSEAKQTKYVHVLLNQRTIPLGRNLKQCGERDDGWCELGDFLAATSSAYADSDFKFSCFGNYSAVPYGQVTNGAPTKEQRKSAGLH